MHCSCLPEAEMEFVWQSELKVYYSWLMEICVPLCPVLEAKGLCKKMEEHLIFVRIYCPFLMEMVHHHKQK